MRVAPAPELGIGEQVASLDVARDALAAGDPSRALHALDEYDARFPGGVLAQEATFVRVKALLAAGNRGEATIVGTRFVDQHPTSPYAARLRELLGETID